MFCDLVGSTALSASLDPEDMRHLLRRYQERCGETISAHGGSVVQYLGDGILAYFGYPAAQEDAAVDAVRAGLGVVRAMAPLGDELGRDGLAARVGLHTGLVVVGQSAGERGHPGSADMLAIGETPNIAARLQSLAGPGEVVIGDTTAALVRGYFVLDSLGTPELKGAGHVVEALRVVGETAAHSRLDVNRSRGLTPLVGRDRELEHLDGAWRAARRGMGSVVLVDGEPGIGKSRLVLEIASRVGAEGALVAEIRCSPRHTHSVLHPVVDLLRRALHPADAVDEAELLTRVERLVVDSGLELDDGVPVVAQLLSLSLPARYPPLPTAPGLLKERTLSVLTRLLLGRTGAGTLLVVEDVQWLDPTSQEVVDALLDVAASNGVLAVLTRRTGTSPDWPARAELTLALGRLDPAAVERMVDQISGSAKPHALRRHVVERTDGVPLFVEELTQMLLDEPEPTDGAEPGETGSAVPSTLRDLLMARLDGQGPSAVVARLAATVGREVPYPLLQRLWSGEEDRLQEHLRQLVDSGLMQHRGDGAASTYVFKHALVQEVAYETLLRSVRVGHHRSIAEAMEAAPGMEAHPPEVLAHHFAEAGLPHRAVPFRLAAGLRAIEQSANLEAVAHLTTGVELLRSMPSDRERDRLELDLLVHLGAPLMATRGYGSVEVEEVYRRAHELGDIVGDPQPLFEALYGMFRMHLLRAEYAVALGIGRRLVDLAERSGRPSFAVAAQRAVGSVMVYVGSDLDRAHEHLTAAIGIDPRGLSDDVERHGLELNDVADPAIVASGYEAWVQWLRGDAAAARVMSDSAIAGATRLGHPFTVALAACFDLWLRQFDGEAEEVARRAEGAAELVGEQGFEFWRGWAGLLRGWALARLGSPDEGVAVMRAGLVDWQATGSRLGTSYFLSLLGEGLALAGRTGEAVETLTEAAAFGVEVGEQFWLPETCRLHARLVADTDREFALELLTRGAALASQQGSVALGKRIRETADALSLTGPEVATRSSGPPSARLAPTGRASAPRPATSAGT